MASLVLGMQGALIVLTTSLRSWGTWIFTVLMTFVLVQLSPLYREAVGLTLTSRSPRRQRQSARCSSWFCWPHRQERIQAAPQDCRISSGGTGSGRYPVQCPAVHGRRSGVDPAGVCSAQLFPVEGGRRSHRPFPKLASDPRQDLAGFAAGSRHAGG